MMGHNMHLKVIWKIIPKLSLLPFLIWSTVSGEATLLFHFCYPSHWWGGEGVNGEGGVGLQGKSSVHTKFFSMDTHLHIHDFLSCF